MVIRVFVSGISGNKEVKKRQQRVTMILDSKNIEYNVIDIAEPGNENQKEFMQGNSQAKDSKYPLPPQIFNEDHYCGDYEGFDMANEMDELEKFLNITQDNTNKVVENGISNGSNTNSEKEGILKEEIRGSTEESVDTVSTTVAGTESINNEIKLSDDSEIPIITDDTSKDLMNTSTDPQDLLKSQEESVEDSNGLLKDPDIIENVPDVIPENENEVSEKPKEHESLKEENIDSDVKSGEDSTGDSDSEE